MNIGFVGAGKVGFTLGRYLAEKGVSVAGYYSRSPASAREAAAFTGSAAFDTPGELADHCDTLFLTVPDGAIAEVWHQARALPIRGKIICHCSGSLSSEVFDGVERTGALACSLHPLCAVHDRLESWKTMDSVYFTVEGASRAELEKLLHVTGNPYSLIDADKKTLYHAACVTVSNLTVGLAQMGAELFARCGLDEDFAQNAWRALFLGNAENIARGGPMRALTGPIERGDADTIRSHLAALDGEALAVYRALSGVLVRVAEEKNPGRDYTDVKETLAK